MTPPPWWWPSSHRREGQSRIKVAEVSATGADPQAYEFDTTGLTSADEANMVRVDKEYAFRAIGNSTVLTCKSLSFGNCGPAIDHVRISVTEATAADCKKSGWRSMVDASGTPFKNQTPCLTCYR